MSEGKTDYYNIKKKILILLVLIFFGVVALSFCYNLVQLIIQPSAVFIVENGRIYQEETTYGYIVREESVLVRRKLSQWISRNKNRRDKDIKRGQCV